MTVKGLLSEELIKERLKDVFDPEIHMSIVDLGFPLYLNNITTLRAYTPPAPTNAIIGFNGRGLNMNLGNGTTLSPLQGIGQLQQNNPLVSAHPNVVMAVFMDGHTQGLTKNTPAPNPKVAGEKPRSLFMLKAAKPTFTRSM